ncbi:outer membrane protein S [Psychromonas marina]|uniref:Outer membrane protein S n=1 Tax=Psychromonas marina TaxID=88364 RepID=A0ABQ6E2A0_9GAMM|nr:carbohydrate porin [Psychromonas marina]GLS91564.1 outer membrane protein S [Psychromonas marina]
MKFKLLPLAAAIATTFVPMSLFAADAAEVKAVNPELTQPADPLYDRQQPLVLAEGMPIPDTGLKFTGYARYGFHYSDDVNKYVGAMGQSAGNATGRLGNEGNGGEFQFTKAFIADNGAIWDVAVMLEHWSDNVGLKKFYAGATNVFESQPTAYLWAGRDFHQRPQQGLNDYFWMMHDGQGAGVYNLGLGDIKFDISGVAQASSGTGDSGNYAITTKLHGISVGAAGTLSFLANYGFESDQYYSEADEDAGDGIEGELKNANKSDAFQLAAVLDSSWSMGGTQLILRYAENADNGVFWKTEDLTTWYASFSGNVKSSETFNTEYLVAYHNADNSADVSQSRSNYSAIVRPMMTWNAVHSTWLEAGYSLVDYENAGENSAWKVTLSQNVSFGLAGARPMIRFYATVGSADNEVASKPYQAEQDTLALGAMFESWW